MEEAVKVTEADVLEALRRVRLPGGEADPVTRGLVRNVRICGGNVAFDLALPAGEPHRAEVEAAVRAAVAAVPGVQVVNVRIAAPQAPAPQTPAPGPGLLPGVRHILAIGSGKGGVGKSTVAVNLAVALAQEGCAVGLLDADAYGPSVPTMMGVREQPFLEGGRLVPPRRFGVRLMSLGFYLQSETETVIWRGPMVGGYVRQMLTDVDWGDLDYLIVDLPPGTGDAQLTLAQSVPLTGAVIVMTGQDVAVRIASKAVGMFRRLRVPVIGVVGNMDTFACPHCGERTPIFTQGGSEEAARRLGVPFLGSVPLDPAIVLHGDRGTPTVAAAPDSPQAEAFRQIARNVVARVAEESAASAGPLAGLAGRLRRP